VIATSGLADVRVKFQGAAPDLPHILAGAGKVTGSCADFPCHRLS
jgi:hypothetical protein